MKPTITKWVLENIKVGDILTCKGYNGHKRVIEITSNNVYASCGSFRKGEFIHNGCASNTSIYNITGIFLDGKFQKIKDLIKKQKMAKQLNGRAGVSKTQGIGSIPILATKLKA